MAALLKSEDSADALGREATGWLELQEAPRSWAAAIPKPCDAQGVAEELADEMFERWAFNLQIKRELDNDSTPIPSLKRCLGKQS